MAACLLHRGQRGADRQRGAVDVGQDHRPPELRGLLEKSALGAESGIDEDDVEAAEALDRALHHLLLLVPLGHVAADGERALVAAELVRELGEPVDGASGEHDPVALAGRMAGGGGADAARGAGDQEHGVGH